MRHHANDLPTNELPLRPGQSVVARVYAAMPFQVSGRTNALKSFARLNKDRGPDFLRLANALSPLYPRQREEKRL